MCTPSSLGTSFCSYPSSLATLRGHSLAVTSVDWVQFGQWNLLVSCSDDRVCIIIMQALVSLASSGLHLCLFLLEAEK